MVKTRRWKYDATVFKGERAGDFLEEAMRQRVSGAVYRQYVSRVQRYVDYLTKFKKDYGLESFTDFLKELLQAGANEQTVASYRTALQFRQEELQGEIFAADARLRAACKGLRAAGKKRKKQHRGAITLSMLRQLQSLPKMEKRYAVAFEVAFFGVLRKGQLMALRAGDYAAPEDGEAAGTLWLRKDKRVNAKNSRTHFHARDNPSPELREVMGALQRNQKKGEKLFAWFSGEKAGRFIKRAAKHYKWPDQVIYDGVHCLRHGGAMLQKNRFLRIQFQMEKACAMTTSTQNWYTRTNGLRRGRGGTEI